MLRAVRNLDFWPRRLRLGLAHVSIGRRGTSRALVTATSRLFCNHGLPPVADFVVIGAGIVGTNIAAVLKHRQPAAKIIVLEKESAAGFHASGRNSGVLHAGMYYASDTLKARLTRAGNVFLTEYCDRKGLPILKCGKLIVAKDASDLLGLDTLLQRGKANGVPLEEVTAEQAARIEPLAKTHLRALWSPSTSSASPQAVLKAQLDDLAAAGVDVQCGVAVKQLSLAEATGPNGVRHVRVHAVRANSGSSSPLSSSTSSSGSSPAAVIEAGHVVNAAGLHADSLAHSLGFGLDFALQPFIGLYMYANLPLKRLVYPVPDLRTPFLGVHFTVTVDGKVKIGPTAIPALYREQYLDPGADISAALSRFSLAEVGQVGSTLLKLLAARPELRTLAISEARKYWRPHMIAGASALVRGAEDPACFGEYGRPGIRAQLVRLRAPQARRDGGAAAGANTSAGSSTTRSAGADSGNGSAGSSNVGTTADSGSSGGYPRLEMDFQIEGDAHSTHVLNAISPAWTSSRPFAEMVVDGLLGRRSQMQDYG